MRVRKEFVPEMFAGNFVRECSPSHRQQRNRKKPTPIRRVELTCFNCKNLFKVSAAAAIRIQQRCCSGSCSAAIDAVFEGGNGKHPLYSRWLSMNQRCNNSGHSNYANYGGRGITISDELKDFETYSNYLDSLPNKDYKLSIDRIDNNGNYEKGNLRWATRSTQVANQRTNSRGTNSYKGVSWSKHHNRWVASISYKCKVVFTAVCINELDAVKARNDFILENDLPHLIQ